MANIGRTLHAGDLERSDIVRINTFTTDMDDFLRTSLGGLRLVRRSSTDLDPRGDPEIFV